IQRGVTITYRGAQNIVVQCSTLAQGRFSIFQIAAGKRVEIVKLTISGGRGTAMGQAPNQFYIGGGILNYGNLILTHVTVDNNTADYGGGIYNAATAKLAVQEQSRISRNGRAIFGVAPRIPDATWGGGVDNLGRVTLQYGVSVDNNFAAFGAGIEN